MGVLGSGRICGGPTRPGSHRRHQTVQRQVLCSPAPERSTPENAPSEAVVVPKEPVVRLGTQVRGQEAHGSSSCAE